MLTRDCSSRSWRNVPISAAARWLSMPNSTTSPRCVRGVHSFLDGLPDKTTAGIRLVVGIGLDVEYASAVLEAAEYGGRVRRDHLFLDRWWMGNVSDEPVLVRRSDPQRFADFWRVSFDLPNLTDRHRALSAEALARGREGSSNPDGPISGCLLRRSYLRLEPRYRPILETHRLGGL